MYRILKKTAACISAISIVIGATALSFFLISPHMTSATTGVLFGFPALILCAFLSGMLFIQKKITTRLYHLLFDRNENALFREFIDRLRFCYSLDDFCKMIVDVLEYKADGAALLMEPSHNYILYNSAAHITARTATALTLQFNYPESWPHGLFFLNDELGITSSKKHARGFFIADVNMRLYVFCRIIQMIEHSLLTELQEEFTHFLNRSKTISSLAYIAEISTEWMQLAETQASFLPQKLPAINHLKLAVYYRPFVNVSGDYYAVLPVTEHKTVVLLGDVSGKGLSAALIMGLVVNTVKIIENKEDLAGIVQTIDKAIKNMHLEDKYTVLFLGIIDTKRMRLSYINASLTAPFVVSPTASGTEIRRLESTAVPVGIIDMALPTVADIPLVPRSVIILGTDGIFEVTNTDNVQLGDSRAMRNAVANAIDTDPAHCIDEIIALLTRYSANGRAHDDMTMLVAQIEA
ncbi:MAG: SpoIIE family protein phosphatase [Treponema sp.]|nr:SpoIIE family protein phosphatase [Treponema sp.]